MRVVFSRKAFDSRLGGVPNPILPNGELLPLPIPYPFAPTTFNDVCWSERGDIAKFVEDLQSSRTVGAPGEEKRIRLRSRDFCHLDPDLRLDSLSRLDGWVPSLGQVGNEQRHLRNHGVRSGDLFLFFGRFREVEQVRGKWHFVANAPTLHLVFGWLQVRECVVVESRSRVLAKYPWLEHHPHLNDLDQWKGENAVWVASPELQVEGLEAPEASGAGTLDYHEALVLTAREERRTQGRCTHWDLTAWWGREENGKFSKFNQPKNLISAAGVNRLLKTTGQWQELIVDTEYYPDLVPWINTTFSSAIRRDRSLIANHQTNGAADGRKADREFHPCQTSRAPHDLNEISRRVIGCAFAVSMALGAGFLEKVYENALAHELRKSGLRVEQQRPIDIWYDGILVGQYVADLVVEGVLLVEMKVVKAIDNIHLAQCLNYLKATGYRLCLLLNFANTKVEVKRIVSSY